jgi:translation initiation factor IF-3
LRIGKLNFRTNHQIQAPKVRLIGADGKQIGVVKMQKALKQAQESGLDLVEIAPRAKPPVVKIVELGKFKYQEEKKVRKQKKKAKSTELKEVRFSPFIADHDYQVRVDRTKEFLADNNKVRLVVVFKGRHMGSKSFGYKLIDRIIADLDENITVDMRPKFIGRHLTSVISPVSKGKTAKEKESK